MVSSPSPTAPHLPTHQILTLSSSLFHYNTTRSKNNDDDDDDNKCKIILLFVGFVPFRFVCFACFGKVLCAQFLLYGFGK